MAKSVLLCDCDCTEASCRWRQAAARQRGSREGVRCALWLRRDGGATVLKVRLLRGFGDQAAAAQEAAALLMEASQRDPVVHEAAGIVAGAVRGCARNVLEAQTLVGGLWEGAGEEDCRAAADAIQRALAAAAASQVTHPRRLLPSPDLGCV
eukprot:1144332-Prorocentrum_minimum.AAC.2